MNAKILFSSNYSKAIITFEHNVNPVFDIIIIHYLYSYVKQLYSRLRCIYKVIIIETEKCISFEVN